MNKALPLKDVRVNDPLFGHYREILRTQMIPYQWSVLNDKAPNGAKSGCMRNFKIAAGREEGKREGVIFLDSDLAKWLEAVSYSLQIKPDPELEKDCDSCVELLKAAQGPDGYLNTYYTLTEPNARWTNLVEGHELYCAGHLIEAAVAYYEATGKREFLDVMCRFADLIDRTFGPEPEKLKGYPGHEEIELALVKLYRVTGNMKYLELAKYFVDQRGQSPLYFPRELAKREGKMHFGEPIMYEGFYSQSHKPVREQREAVGHAVRAAYLFCAVADIAAETGDSDLEASCLAIYEDIVTKKMFVTCGIGSSSLGERFTAAYDLPGDRCYCETCACIGLALFSLRMGRTTGEARYFDTVERCLYNNVLSGVNRAGDRFFYVNPLEVTPAINDVNAEMRHIKTTRQEWFDVACCPTNIARTLGSLAQYMFTWTEDMLYVHLFIACEADLPDGSKLKLETRYPTNGLTRFALDLKAGLTFAMRVPAHSALKGIKIDGRSAEYRCDKGYALINLTAGEHEIEAEFDVKPKFVYSDPRVPYSAGKAALTLGPVVYCFEEADNGKNLMALSIDTDATPVLTDNPVDPATPAIKLNGWADEISGEAYADQKPKKTKRELLAVPYYCWNNRGIGEMRVWMRT